MFVPSLSWQVVVVHNTTYSSGGHTVAAAYVRTQAKEKGWLDDTAHLATVIAVPVACLCICAGGAYVVRRNRANKGQSALDENLNAGIQ